MSESLTGDAAVIALEERPTGDFIDGYLAGLATVNAALAGAPQNSFFYSFDWIGDGSESLEESLHAAFQSEPSGMSFQIAPIEDWEAVLSAYSKRWLGRDLTDAAAHALADEFVELMVAFIAGSAAHVYEVRPAPAPGRADFEPRIGASYDHLLFDTIDGRLLLEFAVDM